MANINMPQQNAPKKTAFWKKALGAAATAAALGGAGYYAYNNNETAKNTMDAIGQRASETGKNFGNWAAEKRRELLPTNQEKLQDQKAGYDELQKQGSKEREEGKDLRNQATNDLSDGKFFSGTQKYFQGLGKTVKSVGTEVDAIRAQEPGDTRSTGVRIGDAIGQGITTGVKGFAHGFDNLVRKAAGYKSREQELDDRTNQNRIESDRLAKEIQAKLKYNREIAAEKEKLKQAQMPQNPNNQPVTM